MTAVKVFPLRIGRTKVPYGQFYGGLDTFSLTEFVQDKDHFIWVPIHAFLIEHPSAGPFLVDTGIGPGQADEHARYYGGSIMEYLMDDDEYDLPAGERIEVQLERHGYRPADIRGVVVTHFHEDHIGSLNLFPGAEVYLGRDEYEARDSKALGLVPLAYPRSIEAVENWRPVDFTGPAIGGFDRSADILGDGSLVLLPTPGHSPGSTSALVRTDSSDLLLTGDAMYTIRHLAVDHVRQMQTDNAETFVDSIRRIQWLHRALPNLVILTSHDHTEYGEHLRGALAGGELSEADLSWAKAWERETFDPVFGINPAKLPRFVPAADGDPVGLAR
ncbi:hypothetical protein GCM10022222_74670 [Amycolatopsis ultiminotia]|uniref:Metallo-beta-lactamase domain-containing protein n=1 Tax=Amycolatopsis ultiminotia TaxID=543629 RepID=A0ABP6YA21_9PSEU